MITLSCAIVGVAGSALPVDIDENKLVGHLKKAIKVEKPNTIQCDADDLQLFLAKKDDAWLPDEDRAALDLENGTIHPDIHKMVHAEQMRATKTLQFWLFEKNKMPQPFADQIHVLVVVPEGAGSLIDVTVLPSAKEIGEMVRNEVNEAFAEQDRKRSIYSLSDLHTEHQLKLVKKMRLLDDFITFDEPAPLPDACIPPYTWLNVPEGADKQRVEYMAYLEKHFKRVLDEKRLSWLDVTTNNAVLSVADPRLPFAMKGTADVLLVDRRSIQHHEPLAGVRMVVELKKKVEQRHKPQAFGELVSASLKAPLNCTPIGLLTDLNDQWHFSWFNEKKVLTHISIVHPKNAFDFIAAAVAEPASSKPFSVPFITGPLTKFKIDDFLPMPDDGADEMMERYELMSDVVEPEFLMARRMDYARQLVQSMPMYSYMYT